MSAIVLAALVLMWAVVLVPMLVRRQERTRDAAAVRRFAGAMRVLSRRRRDGIDSGSVPAGRRNLPLTGIRRVGALSAERRAAIISAAFATVPSRPARSNRSAHLTQSAPSAGPGRRTVSAAGTAPSAAARRRAARVAARRRGLVVLGSALVVTAALALLLGGWLIAVQGLTDVLVLAGLVQMRASTVADRSARARSKTVARPEARITTDAPTSHAKPPTVDVPPRIETIAHQSQAGRGEPTPVVHRSGKQIVFDAVTEMPIVERPRLRDPVRRPAPAQARRVRGDMPTDFLEMPASPPRPERMHAPLLDEVDTDPDTMTAGLELLDGILSRRASGE